MHVVATSKNAYEIKYYKIDNPEEEESGDEEKEEKKIK